MQDNKNDKSKNNSNSISPTIYHNNITQRYFLFALFLIFVFLNLSFSVIPVTACQNLTTSNEVYVLQNDVATPSSGSCFTNSILNWFDVASNIVLDCQGHSINVTGGGGSFGMSLGARYNNTYFVVKNCVINGGYAGINMFQQAGSNVTFTIINNTINNASNSGIIFNIFHDNSDVYLNVTNNTLNHSGSITSGSIMLFFTDLINPSTNLTMRGIVENNVIVNSGGDGIFVAQPNPTTVTNVSIRDFVIRNNNVTNTTGFSILVGGGSVDSRSGFKIINVTVENNIIDNLGNPSESPGIILGFRPGNPTGTNENITIANNTIRNNIIRNFGDVGLAAFIYQGATTDETGGNIIENNTIENTGFNYDSNNIYKASMVIGISNSTVRNNLIRNVKNIGIALGSTSINTTLENNTIVNSSRLGIFVDLKGLGGVYKSKIVNNTIENITNTNSSELTAGISMENGGYDWNLVSENKIKNVFGNLSTTIKAMGIYLNSAHNVIIESNLIQNLSAPPGSAVAGIMLVSSGNNNITNNSINNSNDMVTLGYGLYSGSFNNTIYNTNISNITAGIQIESQAGEVSSINNIIENNTFYNISGFGINLKGDVSSTIINNNSCVLPALASYPFGFASCILIENGTGWDMPTNNNVTNNILSGPGSSYATGGIGLQGNLWDGPSNNIIQNNTISNMQVALGVTNGAFSNNVIENLINNVMIGMIIAAGASSNTIANNTINVSIAGIELINTNPSSVNPTSYNVIADNRIDNSLYVDIYPVFTQPSTSLTDNCLNDIYNNNGSGGKEILYLNQNNNSSSINGEYAEIIACGADNVTFDNISINSSDSTNGFIGLFLTNSTINNLRSNKNFINMLISSYNINITNASIVNPLMGFYLIDTENITFNGTINSSNFGFVDYDILTPSLNYNLTNRSNNNITAYLSNSTFIVNLTYSNGSNLLSNLTLDNGIGENVTKASLYISNITTGNPLTLSWAQQPANLTNGSEVIPSFNGKFINLSSPLLIDELSFYWNNSETTNLSNESLIQLWKYDGSNWVLQNDTPDITNNKISLSNFTPGSIYGLFYFGNFSSPSPPPLPPKEEKNKPLSISTTFICPDNVLRVTVTSSGNKVSDARVTVRNNQINYLEGRNTDDDGIALFNINQGGNYNLEAHKSGYEDAEKTISITLCPKEQMNETKNETKQPSTERETPIMVQTPPPERIVILAPEEGFVGDNITIAARYENGTEAKGIKITIVTRDKPIELITNEQGFAYYVASINGYYIYTSDNPIAKSKITYIKEKEVKEYRIEVPLRIVRTTPVYITPNTIGPFTLEVYLGNQLVSSQTGVGRASLTLPEGNYKVVIRSSNAIRGANIDIPFEPQTIKINTVEFFAIALFIALGFTLILFIRDYLRQREKMRKEKTESS